MAVKVLCEDIDAHVRSLIRRMEDGIMKFSDIQRQLGAVGDLGLALRLAKISVAEYQNLSGTIDSYKAGLPAIVKLTGRADWKNSVNSPLHLVFADQTTAKEVLGKVPKGRAYIFKGKSWDVTGPYSEAEAELILLKHYEKLRSHVDYLKHRQETESPEYVRRTIPDSVKREVWNRDGAKCSKCQSVYNLEYDHVIPVSKGGSNTARNIELLCERCNRLKGNSI